MKMFKMFGLAVLAALMAMAFVGASSAMAEDTALCTADGTPCEAVAHIHEESVGKAKLLTSLGTTECNVLFLGDVQSTGSPLTIKGTFTYSNCELAGSECKATEENGPTELEVLKEGHETASVKGKGLVHLVCGKTIDCSYNGTGLKGTVKGPLLSEQTPDNGEVSLTGQETTKEAGGFLCPKTAKLDITTTPLEETFIVTGLHYCVEYERQHGQYTNNTCTTLTGTPPTRTGRYMLVVDQAGLAAGAFRCYKLVALPHNGLFKDSACTEDPKNEEELFEKGEIKTVQ